MYLSSAKVVLKTKPYFLETRERSYGRKEVWSLLEESKSPRILNLKRKFDRKLKVINSSLHFTWIVQGMLEAK